MKKYVAGALMAVLAMGTIASVSAAENDHQNGIRNHRPGNEQQNHPFMEEIKAALEAGDYSLVPAEAQDRLTEEKFNEMIERHAQMEAKRAEFEAAREAVKAAVESGDYEAFQTATAEGPRAGELTEEQFNVLVQAHALRDAGDTEGAKALLDEAGIKPPKGKYRNKEGRHHLQES